MGREGGGGWFSNPSQSSLYLKLGMELKVNDGPCQFQGK